MQYACMLYAHKSPFLLLVCPSLQQSSNQHKKKPEPGPNPVSDYLDLNTVKQYIQYPVEDMTFCSMHTVK